MTRGRSDIWRPRKRWLFWDSNILLTKSAKWI